MHIVPSRPAGGAALRAALARPWRTLPIVGAVLLTLLVPSEARSADAGPPMDYIAQADKLSQPIYPEVVTEVTELPMADGETIYLEVTRPDPALHGEGPWPVILEASPYHGTLHERTGTRIFPDPEEGNEQIGLTGYFAPRGYAVAMMDLRGTGRSTGCLDHLGPNDASDLKITVEWLADQPWSNGRVGMTGHSYVGSTPSIAAAQRPDGLATIVPSAGLASMYDHQFNKGVPWRLQWVGPMVAYEGLALVRDLPPGFNEPFLTGAPTGDNWENGPNPQIGCGMQHSSLTAGSGQATGQYELWHARRDWRDGAADADIPVFMVHGVNDNAARIPAAEWFFANRFMRPGDKVWIGQWNHGSGRLSSCADGNSRVSHPNCRFDQWTHALHAWFDHHLQQRTWVDAEGVEHPIDTGPAVEAYLNGAAPVDPQQTRDPETKGGKVLTSDGWRRYPRIELFPDATDGSLGFAEPAEAGSASFSTAANGVLLHAGAQDVEFGSEPLTEDAVFLGLPRLTLNASVSEAEIVHIVAILYREDPTGAREPINHCAIQPMLRHGVHDLAPVIPTQEMVLPLQCFTMAHWVPAGDRLVLEVKTFSGHHASFGGPSTVTLHTGPDKGSYLLPQVPTPVLHDDVPLHAS